MEMSFCRRCGMSLIHQTKHVFKCDNGHTIFANCSPAVGVFILKDDNTVLLSRRGIEPRKGMLDSFGGFVDGEETVESAATRELLEETDLATNNYSPLEFLCTSVGHYPYQNEVLSVLTTFFTVKLNPGVTLQASDDVADVIELAIDEVDPDQLHDDDIRAGFKKLQQVLRSKVNV